MSQWAIIRSNIYDVEIDDSENDDENSEKVLGDPVLCGLYSSKNVAVDEILKLYIEDNIDDTPNPDTPDTPDTPGNNNNRGIDIEELSVHRQRLLNDEIYNTYTHIGNKYTLVECVLEAKHEFSEDVMAVFNKTI